jgi:hypothetical protein
MASMKSIGRLYATGQASAGQPEPERAKCPNFEHSERTLPVRAKFSVRREESAVEYEFDPSTIMSTMAPDTPVNRAGAFEALAHQERLMRMARRLAARNWQDFPVPPS